MGKINSAMSLFLAATVATAALPSCSAGEDDIDHKPSYDELPLKRDEIVNLFCGSGQPCSDTNAVDKDQDSFNGELVLLSCPVVYQTGDEGRVMFRRTFAMTESRLADIKDRTISTDYRYVYKDEFTSIWLSDCEEPVRVTGDCDDSNPDNTQPYVGPAHRQFALDSDGDGYSEQVRSKYKSFNCDFDLKDQDPRYVPVDDVDKEVLDLHPENPNNPGKCFQTVRVGLDGAGYIGDNKSTRLKFRSNNYSRTDNWPYGFTLFTQFDEPVQMNSGAQIEKIQISGDFDCDPSGDFGHMKFMSFVNTDNEPVGIRINGETGVAINNYCLESRAARPGASVRFDHYTYVDYPLSNPTAPWFGDVDGRSTIPHITDLDTSLSSGPRICGSLTYIRMPQELFIPFLCRTQGDVYCSLLTN